MHEERKWWKEGVVYQLYPRSFADSNGDGIGDIPGIIGKLDYLKWLGADIIWLNPVYKSPGDDNGYDISDYLDIEPVFGTLEDFRDLLEGVHARGMKLVMDLVVNHSSDEHPWFSESRKSRDNPFRDYYIWQPPAPDGGPPNDWLSFFEGPAWEYDSLTGEYYLHLFSRKQPDLNWENPELRQQVYAIMRRWLDMGVDGFRMDVINLISKNRDFPNAVPGSLSRIVGGEHFINGPKVVDYLTEMRREVLDHYDIMTVGETPDVDVAVGLDYVGTPDGPLDMLFQFDHMDLDNGPEGYWDIGPWTPAKLFSIIADWQYGMEGKGWNSLYLNNHDQPRQLSRFGDDRTYSKESAKLLALFIHTLKGTPYIYQGEEIGMCNCRFPEVSAFRDIASLNFRLRALSEGKSETEILRRIQYRGRDNARTPMQWNHSEYAGFSTSEPWIQCNSNFRLVNIERQMKDESSILKFYKRLLEQRKRNPVFVYGEFAEICGRKGGPVAYTRTLEERELLVVLNWSGDNVVFPQAALALLNRAGGWELLLSNYSEEISKNNFSRGIMLPWEGVVYQR